MERSRLAICARLAALAIAVAVALPLSACGGAPASSSRSLAATVASRLQSVRGLRFRSVPRVTVVGVTALATIEQRQQEATQAALPPQGRERSARYATEQRATDEAGYLIGLLGPGEADTVADGPALGELEGLYDASSRRIFVIRPAVGSSSRARAMVLAHELEHALDAQHFGADDSLGNPASDSTTADEAVREGTATLVQLLYAQRYLGAPPAAEVIPKLRPSLPGDSRVARDTDSEIAFIFGAGTRFVYDLYVRGHGWNLVNRALASPPATTAQILHPELYLRGVAARPVSVSARPYLTGVWHRTLVGDVGEEDLAQLLDRATTPAQAASAAPAWAGGRFELWEREPGFDRCAPPCRDHAALLVTVRWRTARAAERFGSELPGYFARDLSARATAPDVWRVEGGAAAAATRQTVTTLAFAPAAPLAQTMAAGALSDALAGR